jgi:hypothetical protein
MQIYYDDNRKRIMCCWGEPTRITVKGGPEGLINRRRCISVRVSPKGMVFKRDCRRHDHKPQLDSLLEFHSRLVAKGFFRRKQRLGNCEVCGDENTAIAGFKPGTKRIISRCREHGRLEAEGWDHGEPARRRGPVSGS